MTITKTRKTSLNSLDDNKLYVNSIKSYPLEQNLHLFKRDLVNKINTVPIIYNEDKI